MQPRTTVPTGYGDGVIWERSGEQQLLGPQVAEIELVEPVEDVTPYPLQIGVALTDDRRYVITRLVLRADAMTAEAGTLSHPPRVAMLMPSPDLPAITPRGLTEVRLPPIIRRALRGECSMRRRNRDGDWVRGVSPDDELPIEYMLAQAIGDNPTRAVADYFHITPQAAAQRVARARRAGLLPPTTKGAR